MNDELKQALSEFVQKGITLLEAGAEQIPLVLQDIVGAYVISSIVWMSIWGVILLVGLAVIGLSVVVYRHDSRGPYDDDWVPLAIIGGVVSLFGVIGTTANLYSYLYGIWFPRLVILDYLKELL